MKYIIAIFIFVSAFSAYCSDDQPTPNELRKKTTTQLRELIEDAYNDLKDTNQKLVDAENERALTDMALQESKANYDLVYKEYTGQMTRANTAEENLYKEQLKTAALKKSNFILKSFMAIAVAMLVFILMANFMSWAAFPLNWIAPFIGAGAAGALIFFIF